MKGQVTFRELNMKACNRSRIDNILNGLWLELFECGLLIVGAESICILIWILK